MELGPGEVWVVSSDMDKFRMERTVLAQHSGLLKTMMDDLPDELELQVQLKGTVLAKIFEYFKKPVNKYTKEGVEWDAMFMEVDQSVHFELAMAANYLDAKGLLELTCLCIGNMIKGKVSQQMRDPFAIAFEVTEEEEAEARREDAWPFQSPRLPSVPTAIPL